MGRILLPTSSPHLSRSLFPPLLPPLSDLPSLLFKIHGSSPSRIIRRRLLFSKSLRCSTIARSSSSSRYGGWDDPLMEDGAESSAGIETFLGIADGKCAMLFFLGFLSALAVSRVRVWNMAALIFTGSGFICGVLFGVAGIGDSPLRKRRTDAELLEEFGAKVSEVRSRLRGFLDLNHPDSGEIERFLGVVESLDLAAVSVRKIVQDFAEDKEPSSKPNPKSSKKMREAPVVPSDLLHFLQSMFKEASIRRASPKIKSESAERSKSMNHETEAVAKRPIINDDDEEDPWLKEPLEGEDNVRSERFSSGITGGTSENPNSSASSRDHGILNGDLHYPSTKESYRQAILQKSSNNSDTRINGEASKNAEKHRIPIDFSEIVADEEQSPSSSSEDEFYRIVKRGSGLLRDAGECLKRRGDEQTAEIFLYKSSRLLQSAVAMNPMNPLALGQLGNSCLLHGELKLKISRDLRSVLLKNNSPDRTNFLKKEKMVSALVDVCEECEQLLIDAGRNYKMIISIDEGDVRALYNWGLALSFRAELIADAGPDAAVDADKIYLAAIEKFGAVMSRSSDCSSGALYRWGMALRRRSQLRPRGSSEKAKLLRQAKSLFEDVLRTDSENLQVRRALHSCISDLSR